MLKALISLRKLRIESEGTSLNKNKTFNELVVKHFSLASVTRSEHCNNTCSKDRKSLQIGGSLRKAGREKDVDDNERVEEAEKPAEEEDEETGIFPEDN